MSILKAGIIRTRESEYASPIGGLRMCVDFRKFNKITLKSRFPMPLIDDLLDTLANKVWFSKLDLKKGYHVYMSMESIKYTSFTTPLGQYKLTSG